MSDEHDDPAPHPYSHDQLRAALIYLTEKYPSLPCPICSSTHWEFEEDPSAGGLLKNVPQPSYVMLDPRAYFGPAPSLPTIHFTCVECGFVRQHRISKVAAKLIEAGKDGK